MTQISNNPISTHAYDGQNRRITRTDHTGMADIDWNTYYNAAWQALEIRKDNDTDPHTQYLYALDYIDAPAQRIRDADTNGSADDTLFYLHDANYNVAALVDDSSNNVTERYSYTSYGQRTVLDNNVTPDGDGISDYLNNLGHQGLPIDPDANLVHNRNRTLHPTLGKFLQRDPLEYVDGMNAYAAYHLMSRGYDPTGTAWVDDLMNDLTDHYRYGNGSTKDISSKEFAAWYLSNRAVYERLERALTIWLHIHMDAKAFEDRAVCHGGTPEAYVEWHRNYQFKTFFTGTEFTAGKGKPSPPRIDPIDGLAFLIGGHSLTFEVDCRAIGDCCTCEWAYECTLKWEIQDRFTDPLDLFNWIEKDIELDGAVPFDYKGGMIQIYTGGGILRNCTPSGPRQGIETQPFA